MTAHTYGDTLKHRGLQPFLWTQFLGAFNDNLFKIVVSMLAVHAATQAERRARSCRSSARCSSCRSCSSPATPGQLADVYSKRTVLVVTKSLEIVAAALGLFAFVAGHLELTYVVALPDRAAGDVLQPGEIRHPARDAARPRPVARQRRARDEHVRGDRRSARRSAASCSTRCTTGCGSSAWRSSAIAVARHGARASRIPRVAPAAPGTAISLESVARDRARHARGCARTACCG